jgi:hypothetical protein
MVAQSPTITSLRPGVARRPTIEGIPVRIDREIMLPDMLTEAEVDRAASSLGLDEAGMDQVRPMLRITRAKSFNRRLLR